MIVIPSERSESRNRHHPDRGIPRSGRSRFACWDRTKPHVLDNVAPDVFDNPVDPRWCAEFFADPRHHLAVALDGDLVVGMASGVHYVHPDKPPDLWINEVAVAATHAGQGIGRRIVSTLVAHGKTLGCREAWVLTSPTNEAAKRTYRAAGAIADEELSVMFTFRIADSSS